VNTEQQTPTNEIYWFVNVVILEVGKLFW